MRYRVDLPTMVLAFKDNHDAAVTIQSGAIIDVVGPATNDDRFVVVKVEDQEFHMFAIDLREHGHKLKNAVAAS